MVVVPVVVVVVAVPVVVWVGELQKLALDCLE